MAMQEGRGATYAAPTVVYRHVEMTMSWRSMGLTLYMAGRSGNW
jgi:hypothetical protein